MCETQRYAPAVLVTVVAVYAAHVYIFVQEISPSGDTGSSVTMGDFVRDVFLEQVLSYTLTCNS